MGVLCAYVVCAGVAHRKALGYVSDFAISHKLNIENLAALPLPPTFTHWAGVITTPEGVWRTTFQVPGGKVERAQLYREPDPNRFVAEAKNLRDVQIYLWFARFPIWRAEQIRDRTVVEITDVRFFRENGQEFENSSPPETPGTKKRKLGGGFTFQVVFDAAGNLLSDGFKAPE
jgi:hypothetical protein